MQSWQDAGLLVVGGMAQWHAPMASGPVALELRLKGPTDAAVTRCGALAMVGGEGSRRFCVCVGCEAQHKAASGDE